METGTVQSIREELRNINFPEHLFPAIYSLEYVYYPADILEIIVICTGYTDNISDKWELLYSYSDDIDGLYVMKWYKRT